MNCMNWWRFFYFFFLNWFINRNWIINVIYVAWEEELENEKIGFFTLFPSKKCQLINPINQYCVKSKTIGFCFKYIINLFILNLSIPGVNKNDATQKKTPLYFRMNKKTPIFCFTNVMTNKISFFDIKFIIRVSSIFWLFFFSASAFFFSGNSAFKKKEWQEIKSLAIS